MLTAAEHIMFSGSGVLKYRAVNAIHYLFQDVFPMDFGPEYDSALQMLMLDFLSRLEKLLPVPDIQQVLEPVNSFFFFFFLSAASLILEIKGNLILGWYVPSK